MAQKTKKFFLNFIKLHGKELISALLFFIILGLFLPAHKALAVWWNPLDWASDIAGALGAVAMKIIGFIFFVIPLFLSAIFAAIMGLILGWIISPDFISLKFTQNPFVDIGLSITKGFANMGFVLFLVVIALATILRIEEYKAKKTLPTLIIIALLINFSPVFCGIIIDFSNVLMNFFLSATTGINGFVNWILGAANLANELLFGSGLDFWANVAAFMQIIVSIVFNCFTGFIFILFSGLFIMRYIMLWILVIISPVAFVSYILPITRRGKSLLNWNQWWEQLIEWCVVGITGGFFLYLGFKMIDLISANPGLFVTQPNWEWKGEPLGIMNNILPYLIPLVLLWISYREIKKTSALFAREVMEVPEKATKAAVKMGVAAGVGIATGGSGIAVLAPLDRATGAIRERMERIPLVGQALGGPGAYRASLKKRTQTETKELESKDSFDLHATIRQPGISTFKRSRSIGILAKRGDLEITPDEARQWLPEAERNGEDMKEIGSVRPDYAPYIPRPRPLPGAPPPPPPPPGVSQADWDITQQVRRMKANKSRDINRLALENEVVVRSLNRDQIQDLTRAGSPQQKQNIVNTIRNITSAAPGPFAPVPPVGPPINGIDRVVINYIADQQVLGTWPA
jgi:hypothetical protein